MSQVRERPDLFNFGAERLKAPGGYLEQMRDNSIRKFPKWVTYKGRKIPMFSCHDANACQRQIGYGLSGADQRIEDVGGALRLYDGEPHGDSLVHWLTEMGYPVTMREKSFSKVVRTKTATFMVRGRIDGVIYLPSIPSDKGSAQEPFILEMKGLSTHTHKRHITDIVNKDYRFQAQCYMWLSGIHRTMFVIKDKNNSFFRFFEMSFNKKVIQSSVRKWSKIVAAHEQGKLLDREYNKPTDLKCTWCRYNHTCWSS